MKKNLIERAGVLYILILLFSRKITRPALARLFFTIGRDFFYPQFRAVFSRRRPPVTDVTHPLDKRIPFVKGELKVYLSFFQLFLKSLSFLYSRYDKRVMPELLEYINELEICYREAGRIYRQHQSTTLRPGLSLNFYSAVIHIFDPHLHCVPSLHVIVLCCCLMHTRNIIRKYKKPSQATSAEYEYIYKWVIRIFSSVLLVKQHSVNCISAGLFFIHVRFPYFDHKMIKQLCKDLFRFSPCTVSAQNEIKAFILKQYKSLVKRFTGVASPGYKEVLLDFLHRYSAGKI